jgi:site-specific recombinase XerD
MLPVIYDALAPLKSLVLDTVPSPNSRRAYSKSLDDFMGWYRAEPRDGFSKATVQQYRASLQDRGLAASTINVRVVAIRRLAAEAADNGLMAPEIAAAISRVKGARQVGHRVGNWLTREQAEGLISAPDTSTLKGKRDRALLGLMLGTGLRREEVCRLTFEHIQQRDGRWVIVDLLGKAGHVRTVPMPSWSKALIDEWADAAHLDEGYIFRPVGKGGHLAGEHLSSQSVWDLVEYYTDKAGLKAAPHDLRRTFAKLAHRGHAPLEQIQLSLGHKSIQTTERYLGVCQDLADAPCDRLGLRVQKT